MPKFTREPGRRGSKPPVARPKSEMCVAASQHLVGHDVAARAGSVGADDFAAFGTSHCLPPTRIDVRDTTTRWDWGSVRGSAGALEVRPVLGARFESAAHRHALVQKQARGRLQMSGEEFRNALLASPYMAIYVMNAVDCRGLGLLSGDATAAYIQCLKRKLDAIGEDATKEQQQAIADEALVEWIAMCEGDDARVSVDVGGYKGIGTVTSFASFSWSYATTFNAASNYVDSGDLAKVHALISRAHGKIIDNVTLSAEQVDAWVAAIAKASTNGVPLVKKATGTVWVAPDVEAGDGSDHSATAYRDRLGLIHLPRNGRTDAEQATLVRLGFDASEFSKKCTAKRPCMFDRPGIRFRALTAAECGEACGSVTPHGCTVNIATPEYTDGLAELTFQAMSDARIDKWSLSPLGRLSGLHADVDKDAEFMAHLLTRAPSGSSPGSFRRSPPWNLEAELDSLLERAT
jgi:hypothetical protein